jgi:hypothetical protein
MLEKLTTHDVQDVSVLFSMTDKCAKATEGHAWHSPATQVAKGESKPSAGAQAQGGGSSNKKKKAGTIQPERPLLQLQRRVGAVAGQEATNAPGSRPIAMTAARSARCTTPCALPRRTVGRSRSSQNNSTKRCNSNAKMARLHASGRASRRWTPRRRKT